MMKKNETRGIRWGELLEPLAAKAEQEGTTVAGLVKRIVRKHLGLAGQNQAVSIGETHDPAPLSLEPARFTVRWGKILTRRMDDRARAENITISDLARKAMRLYLANNELPRVEQFKGELEQFRREVARIGGNLNQIAVHMNSEGTLKTTELGQNHIEMRKLFGELIDYYKRMEKALDRQIP